MYIVLDRSLCKKPKDTCLRCFGGHVRNEDFATADCIVSLDHQDRSELVFSIFDRDQSFKNLVVKEENLKQALDSWIALWEEQAGPII